jgi:hypothetical protein
MAWRAAGVILTFGGGATTTRLGMEGGAGAVFTGGAMGRALGCAATAMPRALIKVGRLTATGTGRAAGRLMTASRVGATCGLAMTWARAICCGSTRIAV